MTARIVEVIVSDDRTVGRGIEGDPIRRVVQVYAKTGRLLAAVEPDEPAYSAWSSLCYGEASA